MTHSTVFGETKWLFNVDFFVNFAIEESRFDVHVFDFPVVNGS